MRTWSGLSASRIAAGMTRGRLDAIRPGQFSRISGLVSGACAAAGCGATSASATAAGVIHERRARAVMRCSLDGAQSGTVLPAKPPHVSAIALRKKAMPVETQIATTGPLAARDIATKGATESARGGDETLGGDHDPAPVLLADRVDAADAGNRVAGFDLDHAETPALDDGHSAIDVAHDPARDDRRRRRLRIGGRRLWRRHRAGGLAGGQRVDALLQAFQRLDRLGELGSRLGLGALDAVEAF